MLKVFLNSLSAHVWSKFDMFDKKKLVKLQKKRENEDEEEVVR